MGPDRVIVLRPATAIERAEPRGYRVPDGAPSGAAPDGPPPEAPADSQDAPAEEG